MDSGFARELENGECSWDLEGEMIQTWKFTNALSVGDWRYRLGTMAMILSLLIWIWITSSLVAGACALPRFPHSVFSYQIVFQSVTFAVINSDVCNDTNRLRRWVSRLSIAAVFFVSFQWPSFFLVMGRLSGNAAGYNCSCSTNTSTSSSGQARLPRTRSHRH
jgi:hypothetical protein